MNKIYALVLCLSWILCDGCGVDTTVSPRAVPMGVPAKLVPAPPEGHVIVKSGGQQAKS